jgi:hypothetical protein
MRRSRIAVLTATVALVASGALATNAWALFHLTKVSEVNPSAGSMDNAFIELQFFADGQNSLGGHDVDYYLANGNLLGSTDLVLVPNGQSQRTVLIGDTGVAGADITNTTLGDALSAVATGGAVCFADGQPPDCVSWGNFTGAGLQPGATGTPVAPAGIPAGQTISRKLSAGCATLLEPSDDTDNSVVDFSLGAPTPRSNATPPTEKACGKKAKKKKCKKKKKKGAGKYAAAAKKKKCKKKKKK